MVDDDGKVVAEWDMDEAEREEAAAEAEAEAAREAANGQG